jgi:hypothetical protein
VRDGLYPAGAQRVRTELGELEDGVKAHAPATLRNREPILGVLSRILPPGGIVLEVASGTGEHAAWFSHRLPAVVWQPTDADIAALASIEAWRAEVAAPSLRPPLRLDMTQRGWERDLPAPDPADGAYRAVVCINMIHIAPWRACVGLVAGSAALLAPEDVLFLYGPFRFGGAFTAPSNEAFDASLRARDPEWGVRDLDEVTELARDHGFERAEVVAMPANNHSVVFRRVSSAR